MVTFQTLIKTDGAATKAGCNMYLHCTPDIMDFRWNNARLLGTNTLHNNANTNCPIETSVGLVGSTTPTGADKMWQHAPASCDSSVTREDVDGTGKVSRQTLITEKNQFIFTYINYEIADL